jgi:integrase
MADTYNQDDTQNNPNQDQDDTQNNPNQDHNPAPPKRKRRKKRRNRNSIGSVWRDRDGTYRGSITVGYDRNGNQMKEHRRGKTEREVIEKLRQVSVKHGATLRAAPERVTVEEWLQRFANKRGEDMRPSTRDNYQHYLAKLIPALGHIELGKLSALQVRDFYSELQEAGLSPSVRQHIHDFFNASCKEAINYGYLRENPVAIAGRPRGGRQTLPKVWTAKQVRVFLKAAQQVRLYAAFYLLVTAGMRRGEVLGLFWDDLDGDTLHIRRSVSVVKNKTVFGLPKTERGVRPVRLSADAIEVLRQHREKQWLEQAVSDDWQDKRLMFATSKGTVTLPNNFRRTFRGLIKKTGLPYIRLHDLRHTYITLARDAGIDAETVAHRVGQDVRVTMSIYSQVTEQRQRKAAVNLDDLLEGDDD